MKLSFVPGELYLAKQPDGLYVVTVRGEEVLKTSSEKAALVKYHQLRKELGGQHPAHEPTSEERAALLRKEIGESLVDENHYAPQALKKGKRSTRTFS